MFIPNREELAWASGFFDGEGCTSAHLSRSKSKYKPERTWKKPILRISQAGPNGGILLERFRKAVGGLGYIYGPAIYRKFPDRKPYFRYQLEKFEEVQAVIAMLWVFLGPDKRAQVKRVFSTCKNHQVLAA